MQVRARDDEAAMAYGRAALSATCVTQQDHELLQDVLSLLAYDEPEKSPSGDMLGNKSREDLAAALNGAVLRSKGRMQESALQRLLQHGVGCAQHDFRRLNLPFSAPCQACCADCRAASIRSWSRMAIRLQL